MSLYVGINNTPKNIVSLLIGKNGGATPASSAYTGGVNSKSLVYSSFNLDKELTKVDPVRALTSGKITKDDIGKTVYIGNSASTCQEWIIIGINHDNTSGTVDLISKYHLAYAALTQYYSSGTTYTDTWLDGRYDLLSDMDSCASYATIYQGFNTDVKASMKYCSKQYCTFSKPDTNSYGFVTKSRKMNIPSIYELGLDGDYCYNGNSKVTFHLGSTYEYFKNGGSVDFTNLDNNTHDYFVRDCNIPSSGLYGSWTNGMPAGGYWGSSMRVYYNSTYSYNSTTTTSAGSADGIVATIRFGK